MGEEIPHLHSPVLGGGDPQTLGQGPGGEEPEELEQRLGVRLGRKKSGSAPVDKEGGQGSGGGGLWHLRAGDPPRSGVQSPPAGCS